MNTANLQVEFTRKLLEKCLACLDRKTPEDMRETTINKIQAFRQLTLDTIENLKKPVLRLGFVGATSSGKSTVVNALIGHAVSPMEKKEMSAGVVRYVDAERQNVYLQIEKPAMSNPDKKLPKGVWKEFRGDLSVSQAYQRMKDTLEAYHALKETDGGHELRSPEVEVHLSSLLSREKKLNLPQEVKLELIDLPGIKESNDAANLKVVQDYLASSVLVIVLNYEETAEGRLETLLDEVGKIIQKFKSAKTIFYVLNKIDTWNPNDDPISETIERIGARIKEQNKEMNIREEVNILPLSALKLYLYQVGYGLSGIPELTDEQIFLLASGIKNHPLYTTLSLEEPPECLDENRSLLAKIHDLNKVTRNGTDEWGQPLAETQIELYKERLQESIKKFREVEKEFLDPKTRKTILDRAWKQSGGADFLEGLSKRIQEHFPRLVIQPALFQWLNEVDDVIQVLKGDKKLAVQATKKNLKELISKLEATQTKLKKSFRTIKQDLNTSFQQFSKALQSGKLIEQKKALDKITHDKYMASLAELPRILEGIKRRASQEIFKRNLEPFLSSPLNESETALVEKLRYAGCDISIAFGLARDLTHIREIYQYFPNRRIDSRDIKDAAKLFSEYQEFFNRAGLRMIEMLGTFFQCALQEKIVHFEGLMKDVISQIQKEMYRIITQDCKIDQETAQVIVPSSNYVAHETRIQFEAKVLGLPYVSGKQENKTEYWTTTRARTWSEWWNNTQPNSIVVEPHSKAYSVLVIPSPTELIDKWDSCISDAVEGMCKGIAKWFENNGDKVINFFQERSNETTGGYMAYAFSRRTEGEQKAKAIERAWEKFDYSDRLHHILKQIDELIEKGTVGKKGT